MTWTGEQLAKYLTISVENIYFDGEVTDYLKDAGANLNGEFHVLDTTPWTGPYVYTA
jgi:hypothetical protein